MEKPKLITPGRGALADLNYNSIVADQGVSSDEDTPDARLVRADDARGAIGISIGRQQSRLVSPTTPAVEKVAALDQSGGFFAGAFDGKASVIAESSAERELEEEASSSDPPTPPDVLQAVRPLPGHQSPQDPLPSPWRAEPKIFERNDRTKSVLRDGFSFGRKRASSGPESGSKSFFASLPSLPKSFTSPFSSRQPNKDGSSSVKPRSDSAPRRPTASTSQRDEGRQAPQRDLALRNPTSQSQSPQRPEIQSPREVEESQATVAALPSEIQLHQVRSRPSALRRSTSDGSFITQRTMSKVESLGDDSRFEDVHDMVNSRFKAIKDSLQDSSIKLPSMPSMSSFSVSNFTPDFLNRERSGSSSSKLPTTSYFPSYTKHQQKPVDPMTRQPYSSAKAAFLDAPVDKQSIDHPNFAKALEQLEGDIVILGGYRGSILRTAEPPHRQLWVPIKVGLNLRKADLEVGIAEEDDTRPSDKVIPGGMLTHIGPVDISRRLLKRLRSCENARNGKLRVHEYGYDWRLHPAFLSKQLLQFLEKLPNNRPGVAKGKRGALVVAHSLGGLITRHAVNMRPELFSGVVYAGVPKTCVNILGPMRNGDEVLLSDRVLTAQVNFTIRTSFALLPLNGRCFFDKETKEEYPVDFFDPQTWIDNRLSPCVGRPLLPLSPPPKPTGISGYVSSMASSLPSMPGWKGTGSKGKTTANPAEATTVSGIEAPDTMRSSGATAVANGNVAKPGKLSNDEEDDEFEAPTPRTAVTIPREDAIAYLTRTLRTVKKFKEELSYIPEHHTSNAYPPISVIYGKTTPTVFGARVQGREGIKHADAYDDLAFASGDGVVLSKAAMVPEGYRTARGGVVSSERGHVTLLGDLEAVGKCINAVIRARKRGVGMRN